MNVRLILLLTVAIAACDNGAARAPVAPAERKATPAASTVLCPIEIRRFTDARGLSLRAKAAKCPLADVVKQIDAQVPQGGPIFALVVQGPDTSEGDGEIPGIWERECLRQGGRGRAVSPEEFLAAYRASKIARALSDLGARKGMNVEPTGFDNFYVLRKPQKKPGECDSDLAVPTIVFGTSGNASPSEK